MPFASLQKAQNKRGTREITKSVEAFLGGNYSEDRAVRMDINVHRLIHLLAKKTEADMNNYASSTATDFMEAYYKVRLNLNIMDSIGAIHLRNPHISTP